MPLKLFKKDKEHKKDPELKAVNKRLDKLEGRVAFVEDSLQVIQREC